MTDDLTAAAAGHEQATLDLAVAVDDLGKSIDHFVGEQRKLVAAHEQVIGAARLVCRAWSLGALDAAHIDTLSQAITEAAAVVS